VRRTNLALRATVLVTPLLLGALAVPSGGLFRGAKFRDLHLYRQYGGSLWRETTRDELVRRWDVNPEDPSDSFARLPVASKDELQRLFVDRFYFGCEGDDPVTASAFDAVRNPGGLRLHATFGSDIGHWDVPVMEQVLEEVFEPLDDGLIDADDLRDFVFTNPVRLWTATNPAFFGGTVVEQAAAAVT